MSSELWNALQSGTLHYCGRIEMLKGNSRTP